MVTIRVSRGCYGVNGRELTGIAGRLGTWLELFRYKRIGYDIHAFPEFKCVGVFLIPLEKLPTQDCILSSTSCEHARKVVLSTRLTLYEIHI